ncbi:MAG TPA: SRPBCC family protein [Solirubrobacterales bacterium]|jgi:uncharacterized membrane protein
MPASTDERLAGFLACFSLGLGTLQLAAPDRVNELAGIRDDAEARRWQGIVGARELAAFALIEATGRRRAMPIWMRVAGDATDLTLLGLAWRGKRRNATRLGIAIGNVATITVVDLYTALRLSGRNSEEAHDRARERRQQPDQRANGGGPMHVKAAVTVKRAREDVYGFWRNFENLPTFMGHVESVENRGGRRTHWKVKAPVGTKIEWDAELEEERPGRLIAWHSLEGSGVENSGKVRFVDAPRNQGTEVHVEFDYDLPGGKVGELLAKAFGEEPTQQTKDDLRRFKQVMETGFVVRSEGSPEGTSARRHIRQRPAQPLAEGSRR